MEMFPQAGKGPARDQVGTKLGVSGRTAERAGYVVRVMDGLERQGHAGAAQQIRQTLKHNGGKAYKTAPQHAPLPGRAWWTASRATTATLSSCLPPAGRRS